MQSSGADLEDLQSILTQMQQLKLVFSVLNNVSLILATILKLRNTIRFQLLDLDGMPLLKVYMENHFISFWILKNKKKIHKIDFCTWQLITLSTHVLLELNLKLAFWFLRVLN
jgi:hypothetical protein